MTIFLAQACSYEAMTKRDETAKLTSQQFRSLT